MKNKKRGFTLIELLVVVLIIGILSAIALPQYQRAVEKSRLTEALVMMDGVKKAAEVIMLSDPEFDGQIIGCSDKDNGKCDILDIDVESGLTCDIGGGDYCRNRNFAFNAGCGGGQCYIDVNRCDDGDIDNNAEKFYLSMRKTDTGEWTTYAFCQQGYEFICQSLAAQGWKLEQD